MAAALIFILLPHFTPSYSEGNALWDCRGKHLYLDDACNTLNQNQKNHCDMISKSKITMCDLGGLVNWYYNNVMQPWGIMLAPFLCPYEAPLTRKQSTLFGSPSGYTSGPAHSAVASFDWSHWRNCIQFIEVIVSFSLIWGHLFREMVTYDVGM